MYRKRFSVHGTGSPKGFTIIELLIVVTLIGILAGMTLTVINSFGLRQKGRDGQRAADLKKIQTALELYFADNRGYPKAAASWENASSYLTSFLVTGEYISNLPTDPSNGVGVNPCSGTGQSYTYKTNNPVTSLASKYIITTRMEVPSSDDPSLCSSLKNWADFAGCTVPPTIYCYGVQNP